MKNFDYRNYLKNNPLLKEIEEEKVITESVNEDARTDAEEEGYKDGIKDEKEDMKEDARTDAEEEGYEDGFKDAKADIRDKLSKMKVSELKQKIRERILNELSEAEEDVNIDVDDTENVDIDTETDVNVTDKEEVDVDDESVESDIEVKTMVPGEDVDVAAVQGLLTKAQQQASKLGDEKLLDQIGNTITYFTRAHVVKVDEGKKKSKELRNEAIGNEDENIAAGLPTQYKMKYKKDIKKPIDMAKHMVDFYQAIQDEEQVDFSKNQNMRMALNYLKKAADEEETELGKGGEAEEQTAAEKEA